MSHLYELTGNMKELEKLAESDPDMVLSVADTLEGIQAEFNDKAQAVMIVANSMDSDIDAIQKELDRLTARKRAIVNRKESLKDYLRENMEANGIKQIKCPLFTINCVHGREVAVVDNEEELPDDFIKPKVTMQVDKAELTKALKEGPVSGAHLERAKSAIKIK
jgi:hypothetical protein